MTRLAARISALFACTVPPFVHAEILDNMGFPTPKTAVVDTTKGTHQVSPKPEPVRVGAQSTRPQSGATGTTPSSILPAPAPPGGASSGLCDGS